jgi:hypothetical protein
VPLADRVVDELARHVEVHGTGRDGLLLHCADGRPVQSQYFASVLLSGGVSVAAAAEYLGHSPAVLLGTYAHLMPADHDRARSAVEAAFRLARHNRVADTRDNALSCGYVLQPQGRRLIPLMKKLCR